MLGFGSPKNNKNMGADMISAQPVSSTVDKDWEIPLPNVLVKNNKDNDKQVPMFGFFSLHEKAMLAQAANQFSQLPEYQNARKEYAELLSELLRLVTHGKQLEAELILKKNPQLLLFKIKVTDYSQRTFDRVNSSTQEGITALQYVEWSRDWRMRDMLLKYIDKDNADLQINEVRTHGVIYKISAEAVKIKEFDNNDREVHVDEKEIEKNVIEKCEKHFDLDSYLKIIRTYIDNFDQWSYKKCFTYMRQVIGWSQRLLPVHIAQEYCQPNRPLMPAPDFSSPIFIRTCDYFNSNIQRVKNWYDFTQSAIGIDCAISRNNTQLGAEGTSVVWPPVGDYHAIKALNELLNQKFDNSPAAVMKIR